MTWDQRIVGVAGLAVGFVVWVAVSLYVAVREVP